MQNRNNNLDTSPHLSKREKISQSLSSTSVVLFLLGPLIFGATWFIANQKGNVHVASNWQIGLQLALFFPVCAFLFAVASLIKPNIQAILIIIASIIFDFMALVYVARITD